MTRYYKQTDGMYILAVGVGAGGTEITKAEYNTLLAEIAPLSSTVILNFLVLPDVEEFIIICSGIKSSKKIPSAVFSSTSFDLT